MDCQKCLSRFIATLLAISLFLGNANGFGGVMRVKRRFVGNHHSLEELKQHDARRHARFLSGSEVIDVPMGGKITQGLYYTHLAIGTPPKNYTVQIDAGSYILWVYCQECIGCATDDDAREIHLTPYNPKTSKSAEIVAGGKGYCEELGPHRKDGPCPFQVAYGDGTEVSGYYVSDFWTYKKVSSGHKSEPAKAKITFGCARRFSSPKGLNGSSIKLGLEGLIGFGFENMSMISQLAASGIVRREFAHCLEPVRGGGIFAIGHVVKPEVKMLSFAPDLGYIVTMESIDLGGKFADLKAIGVKFADRLALIDSGTTLCQLPEALTNFVNQEIFSNKSNLNVYQDDGTSCFNHSGSLDMTGFPSVNFHLSSLDSVANNTLTVPPHDYIIKVGDHTWCIGFGSTPNGRSGLVLGDIALSNKLVIYDGENYKIGWKEYDCSSSIKVEDGDGRVYDVGAHSESSPNSSN